VNIARDAELAGQLQLIEGLEVEDLDQVLVVNDDQLLVLLVHRHHRDLVNLDGQSCSIRNENNFFFQK